MPAIVGLVKLEIPIQRTINPDFKESIAHVPFDTDGQPWGLVSRLLTLERTPAGVLSRLTFDRWVRFDALPFASDEVVKPGAREWVEYYTNIGRDRG